jgi:hypothetical protein
LKTIQANLLMRDHLQVDDYSPAPWAMTRRWA